MFAAYGRYLARTTAEAPPGHRGNTADLRLYTTPEQKDVLWVAVRNGNHVPWWLNGVSIDNDANTQSTMTHWTVEVIPPREEPPALPLPAPQHPEESRRIIVYVQADGLVNFDPNATRTCYFYGRSVANLRSTLANHLNEDCVDNITTCARAGFQGRLTPLVVDLPRNQEPMFIVLLTTGSPVS
nr:unnamed protein product [Digitaria exilis]